MPPTNVWGDSRITFYWAERPLCKRVLALGGTVFRACSRRVVGSGWVPVMEPAPARRRGTGAASMVDARLRRIVGEPAPLHVGQARQSAAGGGPLPDELFVDRAGTGGRTHRIRRCDRLDALPWGRRGSPCHKTANARPRAKSLPGYGGEVRQERFFDPVPLDGERALANRQLQPSSVQVNG